MEFAFIYGGPANFGIAAPKDAFPKAKDAALKALAMDDTITEAHASLGFIKTFYDWDWSGAAERDWDNVCLAMQLSQSLGRNQYSAFVGRNN